MVGICLQSCEPSGLGIGYLKGVRESVGSVVLSEHDRPLPSRASLRVETEIMKEPKKKINKYTTVEPLSK